MRVGIALIPNFIDTFRLLSVSTFPTLTLPAYSSAISSIVGASIRQGMHHSAQKSTRAAPPSAMTSLSKLSSVSSNTFAEPMESSFFLGHCIREILGWPAWVVKHLTPDDYARLKLGLCSSCLSRGNLDLSRLYRLGPRKGDYQQAIRHLRLNPVAIDLVTQRERAEIFRPAEPYISRGVIFGHINTSSIGPDGQHAFVYTNVDFVFVSSGNL